MPGRIFIHTDSHMKTVMFQILCLHKLPSLPPSPSLFPCLHCKQLHQKRILSTGRTSKIRGSSLVVLISKGLFRGWSSPYFWSDEWKGVLKKEITVQCALSQIELDGSLGSILSGVRQVSLYQRIRPWSIYWNIPGDMAKFGSTF